jgi:hypothetical protein
MLDKGQIKFLFTSKCILHPKKKFAKKNNFFYINVEIIILVCFWE